LAGDQLAEVGSGISLRRAERADEGNAAEETDPFADDDGPGPAAPEVRWVDVGAVRRLRSGTYVAESPDE
jgi:hypothetical protein